MDGMDATTEQRWQRRERNTISSSIYAFVLPALSLNTKFIRIFVK
jgi:hypothetical protein